MSDSHTLTPDGESTVLLEPQLKEPPRFAVYLHNDNYTTMDFVVMILREVFFKNEEEAIALMLKVHTEGIARCGSYVKEIAQTKILQVSDRARLAGFPLLCTMEEE